MVDAATHALLAFVFTSFVIELTPGPNMAYLAGLSLTRGSRAGFAAVGGIALGLMISGGAVALGVGTMIETYNWLYQTLRWGGVAYLLWLAWDAWRTQPNSSTENAEHEPPRAAFQRELITNLLNPKAFMFYIAVLPEFVRIEAGSIATQTLMLSVTYVLVATLIHSTIVVLASQSRRLIQTADNLTIRRSFAILLAGIAVWFAVSTAPR